MYNCYKGVNKYVVWVAIVFSLLMWYRIHKFNDATMDAVREAEGRGPKGPVDAAAIAEKFDSELVKVRGLLDSFDYAEADRVFRDASGDVERCFSCENLTKMPDGRTLSAWHQERLKEFNAGPLVQSCMMLMERLKAGEGSFDDVTVFRHGFSGGYSYMRDKVIRENMSEVESRRAELAHNWVRIHVSGTYVLYEDAARKAVTERADTCAPYRIIYGRELGYKERSRTAKTIKIHITESAALYGFEGRASTRGSAKIPDKLVMDFAVRNGEGGNTFSSSWDDLPQIVIEEKLPESYMFKFKNERQSADFDSIIKKQREILRDRMIEALKKLPPLKVQ